MDSLKDWASVLEWLKRPFFAFVAAIILGALLLSSDILDWLGLGSFRWIVAILFVLALCILLSQVLATIWAAATTAIRSCRQNRAIAKNRRKRLNKLTNDEKLVLKRYIDGQTRTQYLDINDGITAGLEAAGIINRMSTTSVGMFSFPYNITDFAWDYLNKNPGILTANGHG